MKNNVLYFDKRKVSIEEMTEHYNFYVNLVNEGFKLLENNDKRANYFSWGFTCG